MNKGTMIEILKRIFLKIIKQPLIPLFIADVVLMSFMPFLILFFKHTSFVLYIIYTISALVLTATVINFKPLVRRLILLFTGDELWLVQSIKSVMKRHKYTALYLESVDFRAGVSVFMGLVLNLVNAVFKLIYGVKYQSFWFGTVGLYYLLYGSIRFFLMQSLRSRKKISSKDEIRRHENRTAIICGVMMLLLNVTVAGIGYLMIVKNETYHYSKAVAIFTAAYTFYYCITAVISAVSFRKHDNAVLTTSKKLNISGAALSLFTLQT